MQWEPKNSPGDLITRAFRLISRVADSRLKPLGVASGQIPIFAALLDGEAALSPTALARLARIEQPTMAATLTRMERDGLIHRRPDSTDGRSSLIHLSTTGLAKAPEVMATLFAARQEMLMGFDEEERATLAALLTRVIANLEEAAKKDDPAFAPPRTKP